MVFDKKVHTNDSDASFNYANDLENRIDAGFVQTGSEMSAMDNDLKIKIDEAVDKKIIVIKSSFNASPGTRQITLPVGFENPFIIGGAYPNVNNVRFNLVGEDRVGYGGVLVRVYNGTMYITHTETYMNSKSIEVVLYKG